MRFNGRLQTDADPQNWLKSELAISGSKVELYAGDDVLGSWSIGQVRAERVDGDRFELFLGNDRAVFAADDALAFSYEALPKLAKNPIAEAAQGIKQKLLGGSRKHSSASVPVAEPVVVDKPEPSLAPEPAEVIPSNVRRLRDLIEVAKANRPDVPDDIDTGDDEFRLTEPTEPELEPGPLWSMPEANFHVLGSHLDEPQPISLSIIEPEAVDALVFEETSPLEDEIERLAKQVRGSPLTPAQTEAALGLIRSLRTLLD